jgi:chromosome segregation ATPase
MATRLERAKRTGAEEEAKKYAGFDGFKAKAEKYDADISALNQKITELEGEKANSATRISELEEKNREYETNSVKMRIARETGLPAELAEKISGKDEAAMRADAETMAKLIKGQHVAPMYHQNGEGGTDAKDAALKNLLKKVRNE